MRSTPLTSCSMGAATVSAITLGLAPGYWAETTIVGGTTSGYCAIGRRSIAIAPTKAMISESTTAKRGRSMKKSAKCMARLLRAGWGARDGHALLRAHARPHCLFRSYLDARAHPLDALDENPVIGLQPFRDDAQAIDHGSGLHWPVFHSVFTIDH